MTDMDKRDFRIVGGKGFALDLPNGVTVSVQWGPGNYCDSDVSNAGFDAPKKAIDSDKHWGSNTAECAAYVTGSDLSWVSVPGYTGVMEPGQETDGGQEWMDDVVGHLNVSQVLDFINRASQIDAKPNPNSIGNRMMKQLEAADLRLEAEANNDA